MHYCFLLLELDSCVNEICVVRFRAGHFQEVRTSFETMILLNVHQPRVHACIRLHLENTILEYPLFELRDSNSSKLSFTEQR